MTITKKIYTLNKRTLLTAISNTNQSINIQNIYTNYSGGFQQIFVRRPLVRFLKRLAPKKKKIRIIYQT